MILWMTAASSAWAIVPSDCAAGDLDCPVPQGLKWECGFIHRLSLQADASTGAVKGWLGLSPKYGGNTVQSAMTCHAEGSADVCAVDTSVAQICDSQDCHYAPWAQKGAKIASIDRLTGKATIVGVDRFRSDLNPAADEWPLRLDCQNRDQVIKSKIRPHECANAELKITTYYSFGFANFYIRGERDGSPVKCQGQMFSAGAGGKRLYAWAHGDVSV